MHINAPHVMIGYKPNTLLWLSRQGESVDPRLLPKVANMTMPLVGTPRMAIAIRRRVLV